MPLLLSSNNGVCEGYAVYGKDTDADRDQLDVRHDITTNHRDAERSARGDGDGDGDGGRGGRGHRLDDVIDMDDVSDSFMGRTFRGAPSARDHEGVCVCVSGKGGGRGGARQ